MVRVCVRCGFKKSDESFSHSYKMSCISCFESKEEDYAGFVPEYLSADELVINETDMQVRYEVNEDGKTCMIIKSSL